MKKHILFLAGVCLVSLITYSSKANVLYSTDFSTYTDGNLDGQDGWAAYSGAGNKLIQVSGGAITLEQSSGSGEDVSHDLGATIGAGDTWYYSFDLSVTASSTPISSTYFALFLQGTSAFEGKLYVDPFTGSDYTLGIQGGNETRVDWSTGLNFASTHNVVVSFDYDTMLTTLWIDPTSESSTSVTTTGTYQDSATAFAFRQSTGNSFETIDNLKVGTTFADVVPGAVPEPSTLAIASLGGLSCLLLFRKKRRV